MIAHIGYKIRSESALRAHQLYRFVYGSSMSYNLRTVICFKQNPSQAGDGHLCAISQILQSTGGYIALAQPQFCGKAIGTLFATPYLATCCLDKAEHSCHQAP
jgi:hypothetical protein